MASADQESVESASPVASMIQNVSARHMHDVALSVPDDRQFLKTWRRSLHECINQQNCRLIQHLVNDSSSSSSSLSSTSDESGITKKCMDVLAKYSRPTWNFASSTRDLTLPTSTTDAHEWATRELGGVSPTTIREHIRKAIKLYTNTATHLAAAETRLQEKLTRLENISSRINDLMFMEPTADLQNMIEPTQTYLNSVLTKINIAEDYADLVEQYKRFVLLKGVVSLADFSRGVKIPTCTICMTKEVGYTVTPCGHTFCDECCQKQLTACYICRVQIRDKMRLFFG